MEKPCKEQPYYQRVKKVIKGSRVKGDAAGGHNNKQYAVRSLASCYRRGQRCPTRPGCNSRAEAALAREGRRIGKGTSAYIPPKDDKGIHNNKQYAVRSLEEEDRKLVAWCYRRGQTTIHPVMEGAVSGKTNSAADEWLQPPLVAHQSRCLFWYLALEVEIARETTSPKVNPNRLR